MPNEYSKLVLSEGKFVYSIIITCKLETNTRINRTGYLNFGFWLLIHVDYNQRYSTIWLAKALPEDGKVVTCELDPKHAKV